MKTEDLDFEKLESIYDELNDGTMPSCLGKVCPSSCCTQHFTTRGKESVQYQTLLWNQAEADFQLAQGLKDIGGVIHRVSGNGYKVPGKRFPDSHLYMLDKCQAPDGSCRLKGRKPILCNTYPLIMDPEHPIVITCPKVVEIFEDRSVVNRILRIRTLLGFTDNDVWEFNAEDTVRKIQASRDLPVQWGAHDYK